MSLEAGSVFARLSGLFEDRGFDQWDRAVHGAETRAAKPVEAKLGAEVDSVGFKEHQAEVAAAGKRSAKAKLGAEVEQSGFQRFMGWLKSIPSKHVTDLDVKTDKSHDRLEKLKLLLEKTNDEIKRRKDFNIRGVDQEIIKQKILQHEIEKTRHQIEETRLASAGLGGGGGGGGGPGRAAGGFLGGAGRLFSGGLTSPASIGAIGAVGPSLLGPAAALTGSAGAAVLGAGAIGIGGLGTAAVGLGAIASVAIPAINNLKKAEKALQAYDKVVALYGAHSKQAEAAQKKLNVEIASVGGSPVKKALESLDKLGERWKRLTKPATASFGKIFALGISDAEKQLPFFSKIVNRTMASAEKAAKPFFAILGGAGMRKAIQNLDNAFNNSLKPISHGFGELALVFARIASSMRPFIEAFAKDFDHWATGVEKATRNSKGLHTTLQGLVAQFVSWVRLTKDLGKLLFDVFGTGAKNGKGLVDQLDHILVRWDKWVNSKQGQKDLHKFFDDTIKLFTELVPLLAMVVAAWAKLSFDLAPQLTKLLKDLAPVLKGVVGGFLDLAEQAAPLLIAGFDVLGKTFIPVLTALLKFVAQHKALLDIVAGLVALNLAIDHTTKLYSVLFGKLGDVKKAWRAIVGAANAANVAQEAGVRARVGDRLAASIINPLNSLKAKASGAWSRFRKWILGASATTGAEAGVAEAEGQTGASWGSRLLSRSKAQWRRFKDWLLRTSATTGAEAGAAEAEGQAGGSWATSLLGNGRRVFARFRKWLIAAAAGAGVLAGEALGSAQAGAMGLISAAGSAIAGFGKWIGARMAAIGALSGASFQTAFILGIAALGAIAGYELAKKLQFHWRIRIDHANILGKSIPVPVPEIWFGDKKPETAPQFSGSPQHMANLAQQSTRIDISKSFHVPLAKGNVSARQQGGPIGGGFGGGDIVHLAAEPGEFVMRKEAVAKHGEGTMHALNKGKNPFAETLLTAAALLVGAAQSAGAESPLSSVTTLSTAFSGSLTAHAPSGFGFQIGGPVRPAIPKPTATGLAADKALPLGAKAFGAIASSATKEGEQTRKGWLQNINKMSHDSEGETDKLRKDTTGHFTKLRKDVGTTTDKLRKDTKDDFTKTRGDTVKVTKSMVDDIEKQTKNLHDDTDQRFTKIGKAIRDRLTGAHVAARREVAGFANDVDHHFARADSAVNTHTRSIQVNTTRGFEAARRAGASRASQMAGSVAGSFSSTDAAVFKASSYIGTAVNEALKSLGAKAIQLNVSKPSGVSAHAGGGVIPGAEFGREDRMTLVDPLGRPRALMAGDEGILTRHQMPFVNRALGVAKAVGESMFGSLGELWDGVTTPHAYAKGGWIRTGATIDPTQGQAPTYSAHGGMSFAELLQAGTNRGLHPTLTQLLGLAGGTYGMPMESSIQVRKPGGNQAYTIFKNDVGSGQPGNPHFTVDLHQRIANLLGWSGNEDIEVAPAGTSPTAGAVNRIKAPKVTGPAGALKTIAAKAVDKLTTAANAYLAKQAPAGGGALQFGTGDYSMYVFPLPGGPGSVGRIDRGQDMESRAGYANYVAIGDATVTGTGTGFPGVTYRLSQGPAAGKEVFDGHTSGVLPGIRGGMKVKAGTPLGKVGGAPFSSSTHVEIGFTKTGNRDIDMNVGPSHYSFTGQMMHDLLHRIAPNIIHNRGGLLPGFARGGPLARAAKAKQKSKKDHKKHVPKFSLGPYLSKQKKTLTRKFSSGIDDNLDTAIAKSEGMLTKLGGWYDTMTSAHDRTEEQPLVDLSAADALFFNQTIGGDWAEGDSFPNWEGGVFGRYLGRDGKPTGGTFVPGIDERLVEILSTLDPLGNYQALIDAPFPKAPADSLMHTGELPNRLGILSFLWQKRFAVQGVKSELKQAIASRQKRQREVKAYLIRLNQRRARIERYLRALRDKKLNRRAFRASVASTYDEQIADTEDEIKAERQHQKSLPKKQRSDTTINRLEGHLSELRREKHKLNAASANAKEAVLKAHAEDALKSIKSNMSFFGGSTTRVGEHGFYGQLGTDIKTAQDLLVKAGETEAELTDSTIPDAKLDASGLASEVGNLLSTVAVRPQQDAATTDTGDSTSAAEIAAAAFAALQEFKEQQKALFAGFGSNFVPAPMAQALFSDPTAQAAGLRFFGATGASAAGAAGLDPATGQIFHQTNYYREGPKDPHIHAFQSLFEFSNAFG